MTARIVAVATVFVFAVQLWALVVGIAPNVNTRAVQLAELVWPGYASELRQDPVAPDCDLADLEVKEKTCSTAPAPAPAADPFADPFAEKPPDDPFAAQPVAAAVSCEAVKALKLECATRHAAFASATERLTGPVVAFRSAELFVSGFAKFPYWKELLAIAMLLGGLATTVRRNHIALREPRQRVEHLASQGGQLLANLALVATNVADWLVQERSSAEIENGALPVVWGLGFLTLAIGNVAWMVRPPPLEDVKTTVGRTLLCIPLYAYMAVFSEVYFLGVEQHASGMAIYLHKFLSTPPVYLGVALYVWAGMLLAETRIASTALDVLMPWKLPVWLLVWVVIVGSALPTAYSGASGIFVLATGTVVFHRLVSAGADPRLAVAATAMSGSLGVVLRPCLVVVLITLLNKQVTTDDLYGWGLWVFALTSGLTLVALIVRRPAPFSLAPAAEALPSSLASMRALLPYLGIGVVVILFYMGPLGTAVNENTASVVLPMLMLALVVYDRATGREGPKAVLPALGRATSESATQVGALLIFMAASVGFGGVLERTEVVNLAPQDLGSTWTAMAFLVVAMIVVGMLTDVLGGVVLVSVTLAPVAYRNGIDPVHFWVMVMSAFELAYLTPPVALNQILTRQVVGKPAHVEDQPVAGGFFARQEHVLLPVVIMATALVVVAFGPLLFY